MSNLIDPQEESKQQLDGTLKEEQLDNVSGGFNPQPDPPKTDNT